NSASFPSGFVRSRTMLRLLRLVARKSEPMLGLRFGPDCRVVSPCGVSTLMISAPISPRIWVAHGPIMTVVNSTTRMPSNVPAIFISCSLGYLEIIAVAAALKLSIRPPSENFPPRSRVDSGAALITSVAFLSLFLTVALSFLTPGRRRPANRCKAQRFAHLAGYFAALSRVNCVADQNGTFNFIEDGGMKIHRAAVRPLSVCPVGFPAPYRSSATSLHWRHGHPQFGAPRHRCV